MSSLLVLTFSPTVNPFSGPFSNELFPELYAKNGELIHTFLEIPNIYPLIAKIRYKMVPEMILIGAFWWADCFKIGLEWGKMKGRRILGRRSEDPHVNHRR
jgi:hypothetical protein